MQKKPGVDIIAAMDDPKLFGSMFQGSSWGMWRVTLKALFGLKMTGAEYDTYRQVSGRSVKPKRPFKELWSVVGRRGGKSRIMALVAVFTACFRSYRGVLAAGERGKVMIIASDRQQAKVVFGYVASLLDGSALLRQMITKRSRLNKS